MDRARWIAAAAAAIAASAAIARPAAAQVTIRPEALPDLDPVLLTDPELDCDWRPGLQRARIDGVLRRHAADVEGTVGASTGGGTQLVITGAVGGTSDTRPAYGALAMTGKLGLGPSNGHGVDLAVHGALARSVIDYRPSPMPMRPAGSTSLRALDGEIAWAHRRGDGGWALPIAVGLEDIEYGLPGEALGTAPLDRVRTVRAGGGYGYRAYHDLIPDAMIGARIDFARSEFTSDAGTDKVDHLAFTVAAEGAATNPNPSPVPLVGELATGLGFALELGGATLRHRTTGAHDRIFVGRFGVVAAGPRGGIGGAAVSVGPGYTPDGAQLARLWRIEARYGTCVGRVCGDARAAMSWLEPLRAPPEYATVSEHQVGARLTYTVHPLARVGVDYRLTHHGAWDDDYDHAVGVVVELGGYTGPTTCAPHGPTSTGRRSAGGARLSDRR